MNKIKHSIKYKALLLLISLILMFAVFLFTVIFSIGGYGKQMKFYTQNYYRVLKVSASLSEFSSAADGYINGTGTYDGKAVSSAFSSFKTEVKELYTVRFKLGGDIRFEIEELNGDITVLNTCVNSILEYEKPSEINDVYKKTLREQINTEKDRMTVIFDMMIELGGSRYRSFKGGVTFVQVLMVFCFIGLAAMIVYTMYFIKTKLAKPIADVCEWSRMFKEGYCDMADLNFGTEDEMEQLAGAFNIVKANLAKANAMKAEYEKLMQKIHDDEEHKKKFVQQLYDEKREKEAISTVAKHDGLTGLYNRRTFDGVVDEFINKKPLGTEGALFLIDMDNFKNVNDTLGHLAGDEALKTLAGTMRIVFNGAYPGRYGGDEFIAFVVGYSEDGELEKLASELCTRMDKVFEHDGKSVNLSVSVGVSTTVGIDEYSELYMNADKALYYSKENGRNQYKLASALK